MTHSYSQDCPNCGKEANFVLETRPFEHHYVTCFHCGLQLMPQITYMDLEELNLCRAENEMEPLDKLSEQEQIF